MSYSYARERLKVETPKAFQNEPSLKEFSGKELKLFLFFPFLMFLMKIYVYIFPVIILDIVSIAVLLLLLLSNERVLHCYISNINVDIV